MHSIIYRIFIFSLVFVACKTNPPRAASGGAAGAHKPESFQAVWESRCFDGEDSGLPGVGLFEKLNLTDPNKMNRKIFFYDFTGEKACSKDNLVMSLEYRGRLKNPELEEEGLYEASISFRGIFLWWNRDREDFIREHDVLQQFFALKTAFHPETGTWRGLVSSKTIAKYPERDGSLFDRLFHIIVNNDKYNDFRSNLGRTLKDNEAAYANAVLPELLLVLLPRPETFIAFKHDKAKGHLFFPAPLKLDGNAASWAERVDVVDQYGRGPDTAMDHWKDDNPLLALPPVTSN